jgi:hypothetical protein
VCVIALVTALGTAGALQQGSPARRYDVTVWVVRPVPKRLPSAIELSKPGFEGGLLRETDRFPPVRSNSELLQQLRRRNPHLRFERVEYTTTQNLAADADHEFKLADAGTLLLHIHERDRATQISRNPRSDKKIRDWYAKFVLGKIMTSIDATSGPMKTKMSAPIAPGRPFFVTNGLGFEIRHTGRGALRGGTSTVGVVQNVILIVSLTPMK